MELTVVYDREVDVLRVLTGESDQEVSCADLEDDPGVLVGLVDDHDTHVVSLEVLGASAYLPLGKCGYDSDADSLTLGSVNHADHHSENGDILTYWCGDMNPVGVTLRQASTHLNSA